MSLGLVLVGPGEAVAQPEAPDGAKAPLLGLHVTLNTRSPLMPGPSLELSDRLGPPRVGPGAAFRAELRHEALRYRDTSPWAYVPRELEDLRVVREARADAAEDILGDALEAAAEVVLRDAAGRTRRKNSNRTNDHRVHTGLRIDSSPTLRLKSKGYQGHTRLDIPLTAHEDIKIRRTRITSRAQGPLVLSGSFGVNPWDESARLGFSCSF